jgi:hypothetical protein
MSDPRDPTKPAGKRPLFLLLAGFLAGTAMGVALDGAWLSRGATPESKASADENAVTFAGAVDSAKGPASEAMVRLLETGRTGGIEQTRNVLAFVDALKPGEYEARLNEALARRKGNQGYELINGLYQKWVEKDRPAALNHALGLEGKDRKTALTAVLTAWAAKKPYETLAWIEENGKGDETRSALYNVFRTIAQTDPEEAIALAERSKSMTSSTGIVNVNTSYLYAIWAETDPRAAATKALAIPNSQERSNALWSLASAWAQADPAAAWDWGLTLERAGDRNAVFRNIITAVTNDGDTSQAIAFLDSLPPGQGRSEAMQQVASVLANSDPEQAFAFVMEHAVNDRDRQAASNVLQQWAKSDPAKAFEIALNDLEPGNARRNALQSVINEVANRDPALAREMLEKLEGKDLENIAYSAANALARQDREGALAWAEALPEGDLKGNALSSIFSDWGREDPLQAVNHGLKIEDAKVRQRSLGNALGAWAYQDAVEAMTWAVENLAKEDQETLIPQSLLYQWVDQDAKAASEWVAALPEGNLRNRSVSNLVSSWANSDLVATGEWIKQLPKGESRDEAAQRYASEVFETDPEAALAWAGSIGNEANRLDQMARFAQQYLRTSPEKAKRWIANSSLPPEKQAELLKAAAQN